MGFIASPHTSAGRIPTTRGYRVFVDTLLTVQSIPSAEVLQLESQLDASDPQRLFASASRLLSDLTQFAGIVVASKRTNAIRHIEFPESFRAAHLMILVSTDGSVQNRILMPAETYTPVN